MLLLAFKQLCADYWSAGFSLRDHTHGGTCARLHPSNTHLTTLAGSFPRTYAIIVYFIIIQMIESNILGPRIVGHAVGLHPVASILALVIGAQLFGAFGALLATPIVAAFWVVIASLYKSLRGERADQILARRRTSWIRRPSHASHLKIRRWGLSNTTSGEDKTASEQTHVT